MKKVNTILFLLSFLLVFSTYGKIEDVALSGKGVNESTIIFDDVNNRGQNVTYYKECNSSWFAIKIFSEKRVFIKQLYINVIYKNATRNSFFYYILFAKNGIILRHGGSGVSSEFYNDFFLHLDFPLINVTIDNMGKAKFSGECRRYEYNISLSAGTYYLIGMHANHDFCRFRIWIDATNISLLETTQGNKSYLLEEMNFLGKINIYLFNYSIMWKGSAEIEINNTFVGCIFLEGEKGITKLKIMLPNGEVERIFVIDARRNYIFGNEEYLNPIIWLQGGKWKFEISRIESHFFSKCFSIICRCKIALDSVL